MLSLGLKIAMYIIMAVQLLAIGYAAHLIRRTKYIVAAGIIRLIVIPPKERIAVRAPLFSANRVANDMVFLHDILKRPRVEQP